MISTATMAISAWLREGSGPSQNHNAKVKIAIAITAGHEPGRHLVGERLNRQFRPLRLLDHADDLSQSRIRAGLRDLEGKASRRIDRPADDLCADAFGLPAAARRSA